MAKKFDWNEAGKGLLTEASQLKKYIDLSDEELKKMEEILDAYPMCITPYYLSLIDKEAGEEDPIRKMCIPSVSETDMSGAFDTSGEGSNTVLRGLQHKYHATALILSTSRCAMYCRHCFRKRLVGADSEGETEGNIAEMAEYVRSHPEISNVLISGGDSFLNTNEVIKEYLERFTQIDSLDFIRFGTRIPIVLPERIYGDDELLDMLEEYGKKKQLFLVTQFNHPKEITQESIKAVDALRKRGVVVRNQTVLLKGVNADPAILGKLFKQLTSIGVIPYYIFQCRPVTGVKNQFQVPVLEGIDIVQKAKDMQNGQGKSVRYCMSHPKGKIEFVGKTHSGKVLMKFHQAKYDEDAGRLFTVEMTDTDCWLPEDIEYGDVL